MQPAESGKILVRVQSVPHREVAEVFRYSTLVQDFTVWYDDPVYNDPEVSWKPQTAASNVRRFESDSAKGG